MAKEVLAIATKSSACDKCKKAIKNSTLYLLQGRRYHWHCLTDDVQTAILNHKHNVVTGKRKDGSVWKAFAYSYPPRPRGKVPV